MMVDHGVAECNDKKEKRRHWQECCKGDEHSTLLILQPSVRLQNKLEFAVRKVMRRTKLEERGKGSRVSATVKKGEGGEQTIYSSYHSPPTTLLILFLHVLFLRRLAVLTQYSTCRTSTDLPSPPQKIVGRVGCATTELYAHELGPPTTNEDGISGRVALSECRPPWVTT